MPCRTMKGGPDVFKVSDYSATEPVLFSHRARIIQPQCPYYSATEPVLFPCLHFVLSCPLLLKGIVQGNFLTKIKNILTCWSLAQVRFEWGKNLNKFPSQLL